MTFGVCGDPGVASIAADAGYDFAEWTVASVLSPREPDEAFDAALKEARAAALAYPVLNVFVPGDLKITGPNVDFEKLRGFVATAMRRARTAGVEVIVFGSGGARRVPDGFDRSVAHGQLIAFCSMAAPLAADHGVTIAVEPLNLSECNVLNTVAECGELVREVSHPGVRLLVDAYHLMHDSDSCEDIVAYGDLLSHAHIATVPNRLAPGAEPCDFGEFFAALARAGYRGRVSIEAKLSDPQKELPAALSELRRYAVG